MMTTLSERWLEIEPLIDRLFDVPAAERAEWLRTHCVDVGVRALVAQALDDAPGVQALERGMAQWLPALVDGLDDLLPHVPGYRVLRFVGAGGMASVFEAQRELPGGPQTVALKLLRLDVHDADERRGFLRSNSWPATTSSSTASTMRSARAIGSPCSWTCARRSSMRTAT